MTDHANAIDEIVELNHDEIDQVAGGTTGQPVQTSEAWGNIRSF